MNETKQFSKKTGIKMADIAAMAGVSRPVVSAVINDRPSNIRVSEQTRQKIKTIIRQTGFRSNALGQALASGKSYLLGLILKDIANSFMPRCIEAIEDVAENSDYGVLLMSIRGYDNERQSKVMNFVANKWVDLQIDATVGSLEENQTPAFADQVFTVTYNGVLYDNGGAGYQRAYSTSSYLNQVGFSNVDWAGAGSYSMVDNLQVVVPEPATMTLLGLGILALVRRKKI